MEKVRSTGVTERRAERSRHDRRRFAGRLRAGERSAPTPLIIGDSDVVRPEHAVELFRLRGGGVPGDLASLPNARLAVLPGTTHVGVMESSDLLLAMIPAFLDAPMPETE